MRLSNLLHLPGGVHEQGRQITFTLRYTDGGQPHQRKVHALMMPISEMDLRKVEQASQTAEALDPAREYLVRFLQATLRDPADPAAPLVEDNADLEALRVGLVGLQYGWFGVQYRLMMADQYPDLISQAEVDKLKAEAADFSAGPQGEQP